MDYADENPGEGIQRIVDSVRRKIAGLVPEATRTVKGKMNDRFGPPLTYLSASGITVVKSRTVKPAVQPHPMMILSWKTDMYRKNFREPPNIRTISSP